MDVNGKLFNDITSSLKIKRGDGETNESWLYRDIYSAVGRTCLFSLCDQLEEGATTSIVHFKSRGERELVALLRAVGADKNPDVPCADIVEEIYNEYLKAGFLYSSPYRIEPSQKTTTTVGNVRFVRGDVYDRFLSMSGLGFYQLVEKDAKKADDTDYQRAFLDMFHVNGMELEAYFQKLMSYANWKEANAQETSEYLRRSGQFKDGYWKKKADLDGAVSIMRTGNPGGYLYYLYKYIGETLYVSALPLWMAENGAYRQIACSILRHNKELPATRYTDLGNTVHIHIQYLFPPEIQSIIKLYSWPVDFWNPKNDFGRIMDRNVWEAIRKCIEPLGYRFKETAKNV